MNYVFLMVLFKVTTNNHVTIKGERGGEKMNKKISSSIIVILIAIMAITFVAPVFAKKLKIPEGQVRMFMSGAGHAAIDVEIEAYYPSNDTTKMELHRINIFGTNVVASTFGPEDHIRIDLWWPPLFMEQPEGIFMPLVVVGTNDDTLAFLRSAFSGLPPSNPLNYFPASDDIVQVDRHGNRITAKLNEDLEVFLLMPTPHYLTIPAFTMELNKYGGSWHKQGTTIMTGWPYASNVTFENEAMGFDANGVLTCEGWNLDKQPMTDGEIAMHRTITFTPPQD
jgi:hypothetical protein